MSRNIYVALLVAAASIFVGCGKKEPAVDSEPFRVAVVEYLKAGSMGMAVHEFKEISVEGDAAIAKVSLNAADVPQVKVRWEFTFERDGDAWRTVSHKE